MAKEKKNKLIPLDKFDEQLPQHLEVDKTTYLDIQARYETIETGRVWRDGLEIICVTVLKKHI